MSEWVSKINNDLFTKIKTLATLKLKSTYPKINFTRVPIDTSTTIFPTVYIQIVDMSEQNLKLERKHINSVYCILQIDVFANDSNRVASEKIAYVINDILKNMEFEIKKIPLPSFNVDFTKTTLRAEKKIVDTEYIKS